MFRLKSLLKLSCSVFESLDWMFGELVEKPGLILSFDSTH